MANIVTRTFFIKNIVKIKQCSNLTAYGFTSIISTKLNNENYYNRVTLKWKIPQINKFYSSDSKNDEKRSISKEVHNKEEKLSLFQKFKIMYRDYWYVLVPVHIVTSTMWFGSFYFMAKSGIDIVALLEHWNVSERLVNPLRDSSMGYFAVSYALYKITTPARYTVTLGGTTISINYLKKWGYIKPVPSKERMKEIYEEKKETLSKSVKETKEGIKEKKENLIETVREAKEGIIEKKDNLIETLEETKKELKEKKTHIVESVKETKRKLESNKTLAENISDIKDKNKY